MPGDHARAARGPRGQQVPPVSPARAVRGRRLVGQEGREGRVRVPGLESEGGQARAAGEGLGLDCGTSRSTAVLAMCGLGKCNCLHQCHCSKNAGDHIAGLVCVAFVERIVGSAFPQDAAHIAGCTIVVANRSQGTRCNRHRTSARTALLRVYLASWDDLSTSGCSRDHGYQRTFLQKPRSAAVLWQCATGAYKR